MLSEEIKSNIEECAALINSLQLSIAFAESASAGKLTYSFAQTEYSGDILKGGLICYDACLKEDILGISKEIIATYTPESQEVTREMAVNLKKLIDADIVVAVTGLTTNGGSEAPGKPVGTMYYCVLYKNELLERKKIFTGSPEQIIDYTIEQIIKSITALLNDGDK